MRGTHVHVEPTGRRASITSAGDANLRVTHAAIICEQSAYHVGAAGRLRRTPGLLRSDQLGGNRPESRCQLGVECPRLDAVRMIDQ